MGGPMSTTMAAGPRARARVSTEYFYFYMALACVAVAFIGFAPTYWMPLTSGGLRVHPVVHLHGLLFFAWSLFSCWQVWLAASGRLKRHRAMGLVGVSFATAMTLAGLAASIASMHVAAAGGFAAAGMEFAIVPVSSILFFAVAVAAAIANVRRPEWHKRLMLVAMVSVLGAPIARWYLVFVLPPGPPGPPPVAIDLPPSLAGCVLLVIGMAYDWRRLGRVHPAYLWGVAALLALKAAEGPMSTTPAWHAVAGWLMGLAV
jgi:hypothetical protein